LLKEETWGRNYVNWGEGERIRPTAFDKMRNQESVKYYADGRTAPLKLKIM
jgi:hypothetical protein